MTLRAAIRRHDGAQLLLVVLGQPHAVHFDERHVGRIDSGDLKGAVHRQFHALGGSLGVSRSNAAEDPVNPVAVAPCIGEPLEDHDAHAFARHDTIGRGVERSTRLFAGAQHAGQG